MSLILEALRKLEREKQTPERGLIVTGATAWAPAEARPGLRLAAIVAAGLLLGAAVWLWRGRPAHAPAPSVAVPGAQDQVVASAPSGAPAANPLPTPALAPDVAPASGAARSGAAEPGPAEAAPGTPRGAASPGASRTAALTRPDSVRDPEPRAATSAGETAGETASAPEAPAADVPAPPEDVVLQAVTERDGQPIAIVNGRLVREGDSFDGIRILRIRATEIEVEVEGRRRTIAF